MAKERTAKKDNDASAVRPFPFLELPPELRNTIYGYTFIDSITVLRHSARVDGRNYHFIQEDPSDQPYHTGLAPLLEANKQIRTEAIEIFFARTKFVVSGIWNDLLLRILMRRLGPQRRAVVSRLCCRELIEGGSVPSARRSTYERRSGMELLEAAVEEWELKGILKGGLEAEIVGAGWKTVELR